MVLMTYTAARQWPPAFKTAESRTGNLFQLNPLPKSVDSEPRTAGTILARLSGSRPSAVQALAAECRKEATPCHMNS
jgi:hypothetical protein